MRDLDFHENLVRRERLKTGSDRSFGLFFAVFCLIVSVSTLWKGDGQVNALVIGSSSCSMAFLTLALLRPGLWLRPTDSGCDLVACSRGSSSRCFGRGLRISCHAHRLVRAGFSSRIP